MKKLTAILAMAMLGQVIAVHAQTDKKSSKQENKTTNKTAKDIPYKIYSNYFLRNDYHSPQKGFEITNMEDLHLIFGEAAINKKFDGIDLKKQMGIGIVLENAAVARTIKIVSVQYDGTNVLLTYSVTEGEKLQAKAHAYMLLAVDIKYKAKVITKVISVK